MAVGKSFFNQFQSSVAFHMDTSHLICFASQVTGFYIKCNTGLKWVKGRESDLRAHERDLPKVQVDYLYEEFITLHKPSLCDSKIRKLKDTKKACTQDKDIKTTCRQYQE